MASTSTDSPSRPKLAPSPFSVPASLPVLPEVPGTDPTRCVLDSFRIAIAKVVADALEPLTLEKVYEGVDYGKKGEDFTVALPRFRLPGKVDELAKKVLAKVCFQCLLLQKYTPMPFATLDCHRGLSAYNHDHVSRVITS